MVVMIVLIVMKMEIEICSSFVPLSQVTTENSFPFLFVDGGRKAQGKIKKMY